MDSAAHSSLARTQSTGGRQPWSSGPCREEGLAKERRVSSGWWGGKTSMNEGHHDLRPKTQAWGLGPFWELRTHLTPKHTKAVFTLPSPPQRGSEEEPWKDPKTPTSLLKPRGDLELSLCPGSTRFSSNSTPYPSALGPGAEHSKAGRPSSKTADSRKRQEARAECHSLSRELGAAGPAQMCRGGLSLSCCPNLHPPQFQPELHPTCWVKLGKRQERSLLS